MEQKQKNRTTRFLSISLVLVLTVSAAIFASLAIFLNRQSAKTIREVSQMYMGGMSEQIAMHFETVISLRLNQVTALVNTVLTEEIHTDPAQQEEMIRNARARELTYLGFYHTDGTFEMLYGSVPELLNPEPFLNSLLDGKSKVTAADSPEGERLVLMGVPAPHAPTEENPCH